MKRDLQARCSGAHLYSHAQKAEARESSIQGQPGLHSETLSQENDLQAAEPTACCLAHISNVLFTSRPSGQQASLHQALHGSRVHAIQPPGNLQWVVRGVHTHREPSKYPMQDILGPPQAHSPCLGMPTMPLPQHLRESHCKEPMVQCLCDCGR
jgi:hypothetical protein